MEFDMEFIDKRNRVWEVFTDRSYFDCVCVISKQPNKERSNECNRTKIYR